MENVIVKWATPTGAARSIEVESLGEALRRLRSLDVTRVHPMSRIAITSADGTLLIAFTVRKRPADELGWYTPERQRDPGWVQRFGHVKDRHLHPTKRVVSRRSAKAKRWAEWQATQE